MRPLPHTEPTQDVLDAIGGRKAYLRYGVVAFAAIQAVGGCILWAAGAEPKLGTPYGG